MLVKFMDLNPLFVNREIRRAGIDPTAGVVIVNSVLLQVNGLVSMAAEDAIGIMLARVVQGCCGDLRRHAEPARIEPVNEPRNGLVLEVELLQQEIE